MNIKSSENNEPSNHASNCVNTIGSRHHAKCVAKHLQPGLKNLYASVRQ